MAQPAGPGESYNEIYDNSVPELVPVIGRNANPGDVDARFRYYEFATDNNVRGHTLDKAELWIPGIRSADHVLEIGCSHGLQLMGLRTERGYNGQLTGYDIRRKQIALGKEIINASNLTDIDLIVGNAEDLSSIEVESVDVVQSWYMLYETNYQRVLAEVWRVLKPSGIFLLTSHGEDNIPVHRDLELLMSAHSKGPFKDPVVGTYDPPKIWPKEFSIEETAKKILAELGFELIYDKRVFRPIRVPHDKKHVFKKSIYTRQNEYDPPMSDEDWNWFMDNFVEHFMRIQIEKNGYIKDYMDRWGAIYQKPPIHKYLLPSFYQWLPIDEQDSTVG